jgi:hypothetical protein
MDKITVKLVEESSEGSEKKFTLVVTDSLLYKLGEELYGNRSINFSKSQILKDFIVKHSGGLIGKNSIGIF